MIRQGLMVLCLLGLTAPTSSVAQHSRSGQVSQVTFTRVFSDVSGHDLNMNWRQAWRIEHFLQHVFPAKELRLEDPNSETHATTSRHVEYALVEQEGYRFVLVHFQTRLASSKNNGANELAVYRLEEDGPNQVWRSRPWHSTYLGFHFQTAKSGWRNIVLFEEGGRDHGFGLAGVFSFHNAKNGLYLHILTPTLPCLHALTLFPVHPLLARNISLEQTEAGHDVALQASDEAFNRSMSQTARVPHRWVFNARKNAFEPEVSTEEASK